jgi:two-component system LytT family response regulator
MIRCVLIDDETKAIVVLKRLIEEHCTELSVVATAQTISEGIGHIKELNPDIVFLDIEMRRETGFDLFSQCFDRKFATIVVSAHEQYAIKAMRFAAHDYLMKPVMLDELLATIDRFKKGRAPIIESNANSGLSLIRIAISTSKGKEFLQQSKIIRLQADGAYTTLFIENEKPIKASYHLAHFVPLLDAQLFLRCHKSHIVNVQHVIKIIQHGPLVLEMSDKSTISVSKSHRAESERRLISGKKE